LTKDHSLQESDTVTVPQYVSSKQADGYNEHSHSIDQNTPVTVGQKAPQREKMSTPLIISQEASLIVEEVLGKTIITHSINTSSFDEDFSEHEDELG
jgi:hypothetical protein